MTRESKRPTLGDVARRIKSLQNTQPASMKALDALRIQIGSLESRLLRMAPVDRLSDAEFSVYSQFGEDGIIQYLMSHIDVPDSSKRFVECGVGDYSECNTRFLLVHGNWEGLIIDCDDAHIRFLERSHLRWRHSIDARQAFVTKDNLPDILDEARFAKELGLLSIDLDGNDYWVWEALTEVRPLVVVIEYNSLFGPSAAVSIPYDPTFSRAAAHHSWLYWGTSLAALEHLAHEKGYRFVGGNSAGNNAFFVREDVGSRLRARTAADEWVSCRYRDSRSPQGDLSYVTSPDARRRLIGDMPLVDVITGETLRVSDLPGAR